MICPSCGHANLPGADQCTQCELDLTAFDRPIPQNVVESSLMSDVVSVLEPRAPVSITVDATLTEALQQMISQSVGAVLVVDAAGALVGILTERDFLSRIAGLVDPDETIVRDLMTSHPETILPQDPLAFALRKMDVGGYRHLAVVEEERPVGVISVRDVLRHLVHLCQDRNV